MIQIQVCSYGLTSPTPSCPPCSITEICFLHGGKFKLICLIWIDRTEDVFFLQLDLLVLPVDCMVWCFSECMMIAVWSTMFHLSIMPCLLILIEPKLPSRDSRSKEGYFSISFFLSFIGKWNNENFLFIGFPMSQVKKKATC